MRIGSEVWDNGNTANDDEYKTSRIDGETSDINKRISNKSLIWYWEKVYQLEFGNLLWNI